MLANALINMYANCNENNAALRVFDDVISDQKLEPTTKTYLAVLLAISNTKKLTPKLLAICDEVEEMCRKEREELHKVRFFS